MLQGKEVLMEDKPDHMITDNDEIFLKRDRTKPPLGEKKKSPPVNLKPLSVGGHMGASDFMKLQLEAECWIYTPSPPHVDTRDEKGSCLPSEAGVIGLKGEKMSSWKNPSTSCPGQSA